MEDVRTIFASQPQDFWKYENSGRFGFETSFPAHNVILLKLKGEIDNEGIELLLNISIWGRNTLAEKKFEASLYAIIDADELEFIDIEARQKIFSTVKQLKYIQKIWCFSKKRWTQSYWRVIKLLLPYIGLELVKNYKEAISQAVDAQGEDLQAEKRNLFAAFDWHWQEDLKTRFFDRYLFKYVQFHDWNMRFEKPNFSAEFFWVDANILYIELNGHLTAQYAKELFHKKLEIMFFLQWNSLKTVHLILNIFELTRASFKAIPVLRLYLKELPIEVRRYIVGSSFVEKLKLGSILNLWEPSMNVDLFTPSVADAFRKVKGFQNKNISPGHEIIKPDRYLQFLLKKQNSLYRNDDRFRRKLFFHLSQLIGNKEKDAAEMVFNNTYFGNEIFHSLELLAADFRLAHTKLENENLHLHQLRSNTLQQQLNPHFIFNVLNSILASVYDESFAMAENLLTDFSLLMRNVIENSQNESVSLDNEIDFLKKYLEMERTRTNMAFDIAIDIDPKLRAKLFRIKIPPMLFQPFLEQAIWHRLMPSKEERVLNVRFEEYVDCVRCRITDNGIGFQKATELRDGKSDTSGIRTVRDRIAALNTIGTQPVRITEKDLNVELQKGSVVEIFIPVMEDEPII